VLRWLAALTARAKAPSSVPIHLFIARHLRRPPEEAALARYDEAGLALLLDFFSRAGDAALAAMAELEWLGRADEGRPRRDRPASRSRSTSQD
jgi:hypothetical protein